VRLGEVGHRQFLRIQDFTADFWQLKAKVPEKKLANVGHRNIGDDFMGCWNSVLVHSDIL